MLGLIAAIHASPSHAQAPPLGTITNFSILAGSGITNTGPSVISGVPANPGDLGSSGATIIGFPPGTVLPPAIIHTIGDAPTLTAKNDLLIAYNNLAARPTNVNLTGQDLGGLVLVPGVYNFSAQAQLTGLLQLNGLGNPNSVFIFNIGSTLTTASASMVQLLNGAQGGNVFWRVGSSATLGTTTSFTGNILALTSITLNTGASINCGAAWALNGAVTLDTNTITLCALLAPAPGPGGGLFAGLLLANATANQFAVANAIDAFIANGGVIPLAFINLANLSPAQLAAAFSQLSGEIGTGAAPAGVQAMNSFLSLVTNPFGDNRAFAQAAAPPPRPWAINKAPALGAGSIGGGADGRRWSVWAAAYGSTGNTGGDAIIGSHDISSRSFGTAVGVDYRLTPYTVIGFALGGGGTNYSLPDGLGSGHSDMFQAAVYAATQIGAAYVSASVAYAWYRVETDRYVNVAGVDHLTAGFNANSVGGRIETGYRFGLPALFDGPGSYGLTPYAAAQFQAFYSPGYSEAAASGLPTFALDYQARTTTVFRTELGGRLDWSTAVNYDSTLTLRASAAWAHDTWSSPESTAMFQALPGSSFIVTGASPPKDLLLASVGTELALRNGLSFGVGLNGEFAAHAERYTATARVRYSW